MRGRVERRGEWRGDGARAGQVSRQVRTAAAAAAAAAAAEATWATILQ